MEIQKNPLKLTHSGVVQSTQYQSHQTAGAAALFPSLHSLWTYNVNIHNLPGTMHKASSATGTTAMGCIHRLLKCALQNWCFTVSK